MTPPIHRNLLWASLRTVRGRLVNADDGSLMGSRKHSVFETVLLLVLIGFRCAGAAADATRLAAEDREALSHPASFVEVRRVEAVPESVWRAFAQTVKDAPPRMANPGEKWQVTDVISERGLPSRRLIFAGLSNTYCVLHFERGGIAHNYQLALFRLAHEGAQFVWGAATPGPLRGLSELPEVLRSPKLQDDPRFFF